MINMVKVIVFAVSPFGARIAKTIEIDSIKIAVKKSKCIYLENELKNKIEVKNIDTKPKYFLIALAFLGKNYTDYTINKKSKWFFNKTAILCMQKKECCIRTLPIANKYPASFNDMWSSTKNDHKNFSMY